MESWRDARPVRKTKDLEDMEVTDELTMYQVQRLLYDVQDKMEDSTRRLAGLIDEYVDAETNWKAHQARVLLHIKDRIASQPADAKSKEKSSSDLREAEVMNTLDEEGTSGRTLYRRYRLLEEQVRIADRSCRTLEKRGSLLQTLAANLRDVG